MRWIYFAPAIVFAVLAALAHVLVRLRLRKVDHALKNYPFTVKRRPEWEKYDQAKAIHAWHKAQRTSRTGRKYLARGKSKVRGTVVPIRKVGR